MTNIEHSTNIFLSYSLCALGMYQIRLLLAFILLPFVILTILKSKDLFEDNLSRVNQHRSPKFEQQQQNSNQVTYGLNLNRKLIGLFEETNPDVDENDQSVAPTVAPTAEPSIEPSWNPSKVPTLLPT
jgi:hypothetical protein